NTRKVTQSRTVTTTPSKWDSSQRKWVLDTAASSTKTETRERDMNDDEHKACTPRLPVQVTHSDWVDVSKDCNTRKVTQSRTVTTTPSKWDSSQRKWVLDTAASSTKTETRERDMNDNEHRECSPRPVDKVTEGEWQDSTEQGAKDCSTRKVKQTRTVTTTPHKWDSSQRKWVLDTAKASKRTETRERDMDERELGECVNVALTVSKDTLTVVKGQPVLEPLTVEATSRTDAGLISLQTVCAPKYEGQAEGDQNALPAGVELVRVKQAPDGVELAGSGARTVGEVDGNATQAELGTYRCWVYATKPGITIDPLTGAATGPNAVEGVGWARKALTVEVVQPALPKTGGAGMNRTAGLGALLIVGVTGGWWLAQTRRKKGVGRRA
ncbi:LPXTG cell wall anchor domain-containing protein, partial [Actinotignum schaalii]